MPAMEAEQTTLAAELDKELAQIPNTPLDDVPDGADAGGNVEHHVVGKKRDYAFKPRQHFELGEALGMMDFELAAKLSGARFVVLQKGLARLERALGQFMLDVHTGKEHGYTEVNPPMLVHDDVMFGTGSCRNLLTINFYLEKCGVSMCSSGRGLADEEIDTIPNRKCVIVRKYIRDDHMTSLAHSHRRSAAHQSCARIDH